LKVANKDPENGNFYNTIGNITQAIDKSIENHVDILLFGFDFKNEDQVDKNPDLKTAIDKAYDNGILLVSKSGDDGDPNLVTENQTYPSIYDNVISVSNYDTSTSKRYKEVVGNKGTSSTGTRIDFTAPGVDIDLTNKYNYDSSEGTGSVYSAAVVAGVAALFKELHPRADYENGVDYNKHIKDLLIKNATPLNGEKMTRSDGSQVDAEFGYGLINGGLKTTSNLFLTLNKNTQLYSEPSTDASLGSYYTLAPQTVRTIGGKQGDGWYLIHVGDWMAPFKDAWVHDDGSISMGGNYATFVDKELYSEPKDASKTGETLSPQDSLWAYEEYNGWVRASTVFGERWFKEGLSQVNPVHYDFGTENYQYLDLLDFPSDSTFAFSYPWDSLEYKIDTVLPQNVKATAYWRNDSTYYYRIEMPNGGLGWVKWGEKKYPEVYNQKYTIFEPVTLYSKPFENNETSVIMNGQNTIDTKLRYNDGNNTWYKFTYTDSKDYWLKLPAKSVSGEPSSMTDKITVNTTETLYNQPYSTDATTLTINDISLAGKQKMIINNVTWYKVNYNNKDYWINPNVHSTFIGNFNIKVLERTYFYRDSGQQIWYYEPGSVISVVERNGESFKFYHSGNNEYYWLKPTDTYNYWLGSPKSGSYPITLTASSTVLYNEPIGIAKYDSGLRLSPQSLTGIEEWWNPEYTNVRWYKVKIWTGEYKWIKF
jgi:hypothetical protein